MIQSPLSLSVVLPVYNEAALLPKAVAQLREFLELRFTDWEIILVESGSRDGSGDVCQELAADSARIRALFEGQRNGFGSALKLGFRQATKDLVLMTTADEPFPLSTIDAALPLLNDHDCVLSYRSIDLRKSLFRKLQSGVYNLMCRVVFKLKVRHVNAAFKLYRRSVLQSFDLVSQGWFIDAEIVYWITRNKVSYAVIPIELVDRPAGTSSVKMTTALSVLGELWFFFRRTRHHTPS